jgi:hypothetical protein
MPYEIKVYGDAELVAAFRGLSRDVRTELRPTLRAAAEPVRSDAETLAVEEIRNIGGRWSRMRIGVTATAVYVAPRSKRSGGSPRPNLAGLLMHRAMQPALDQNRDQVTADVDLLIRAAAARHGFL